MKCEISIRLELDKFVGIVLFIENGAGEGGVQKIRKWFQSPRKPGLSLVSQNCHYSRISVRMMNMKAD